MNPVIQTNDLTKRYGRVQAVNGVDLEVHEGEVFGYLGPNGAGKSTTIRVLMDHIRPTSGTASVFGLDSRVDSREIKKRVGYLPGELALYNHMTGEDLLSYASNLRGGVDWRYVEELAERLKSDLSRKFSSLSSGNKQKIGLIQAFMNKPDLVILDEPTSGLDPLVQQEFYRLIEEVKADGRTVFFSSHILPEIERTCDRVGIIRSGDLVAVEHVDTLKERAIHRLEMRFSGPVPKKAFVGLPGVDEVKVEDSILSCTIKGTPDAVIKAAAKFEVVKLVSHEPSLEEIFLAYYSADGSGGDTDAE